MTYNNEDLKKTLGIEIVLCTACGKPIEIPKGSITQPKFCIRCFHENKELWLYQLNYNTLENLRDCFRD